MEDERQYKFEDMHPSPWYCPPWQDGCVFDSKDEVICVVNDNETRAVISAAPSMLMLLERIDKEGVIVSDSLRMEVEKLIREIRVDLWQKRSRA